MSDEHINDEEKARRHLTVVAYALVRRFGAPKAAALLLGATAGVVQHEVNQPPADWFREMADEFERSDEEDGGGIFKQPRADM